MTRPEDALEGLEFVNSSLRGRFLKDSRTQGLVYIPGAVACSVAPHQPTSPYNFNVQQSILSFISSRCPFHLPLNPVRGSAFIAQSLL
jgi:hypothetical protein